jgi:LemA protein
MDKFIGYIIAAAVCLLLAIVIIAMYNRFVALREQVRAAWAQIDVLLKRRHDLIPNLVATVKGYAVHESKTLEAVVAARNAAVAGGGSVADKGKLEGVLGGALRRMMVVAESYPELRANANFTQLQGELANTENQIAQSRQGYNGIVATFNTAIQRFPGNLVATLFGFQSQQFFELQDVAEREVPKVEF